MIESVVVLMRFFVKFKFSFSFSQIEDEEECFAPQLQFLIQTGVPQFIFEIYMRLIYRNHCLTYGLQ